MLCTIDSGTTWTDATDYSSTFSGRVNAIAMASTTVGFAGGSSGALLTGTLATDGTSTWAKYADSTTGNFYGIAVYDPTTSDQKACAVGASSGGGTLIYVTTDGGTSWAAPTSTIPTCTGLRAVAF